MIQIDVTKEELQSLIQMMESSNVLVGFAEQALKLLNKLKVANK